MLYFAYGSNMNWNQIRCRCPSARFAFVARAAGYGLAFTRFSQKRKCGVADIVTSLGNEVWGVVFDIPNDEIDKLDQSEGYRPERAREKNAYERCQLEVICQEDANSPIAVWTYFVVSKSNLPLKPAVEYKALILDGARHWRLPAAYIERLERIETS
jgi:gamma-glutamylcyclotransferase